MLLESKNLVKRYADKTVVDDVSITIEEGRIYALLGQNGSGKTTLMKMAAGLVKPNEGSITYHGKKLGIDSKREVAYMPTEPYFYGYMTVKDAGSYYKDFYEDFNSDRFDTMLSKMELDKKDKVKNLSSGLVAKLKLALTLARDAKLYLLDEPFNGIDILTRELVITAILETAREDRAIVISSHIIEDLEKIVDQVILLKQGTVKFIGDAEELREDQGKSIIEVYKEILA
jgi:ABC-2 type transport system ATP-binding protein